MKPKTPKNRMEALDLALTMLCDRSRVAVMLRQKIDKQFPAGKEPAPKAATPSVTIPLAALDGAMLKLLAEHLHDAAEEKPSPELMAPVEALCAEHRRRVAAKKQPKEPA